MGIQQWSLRLSIAVPSVVYRCPGLRIGLKPTCHGSRPNVKSASHVAIGVMLCMRLLAVDMDNVVADWDQGLVDRWVEARPHQPYVRLEDRKHFFADEDYPEEDRDFVLSLHRTPGFYRNLRPMPGALYALKTMQEMGMDIILLTSPEVHDTCAQEKVAWVREHLGSDWVHRMVLTRDKTLVRAEKLIDDRPDIEGRFDPMWEHLVFTRPYNKHITDRTRITWLTWRSVLGL